MHRGVIEIKSSISSSECRGHVHQSTKRKNNL